MTNKTQVTKPMHTVSAKQSDPVMKLIKQIDAKDIANDVNVTGEPPQGREILHVAQTTLVILTASEQRRR